MKLSVVVPAYNEESGIESFNALLIDELSKEDIDYEVIYCDDGSKDNTVSVIKDLIHKNKRIKLLALSRNFGKEYALTAGIMQTKTDAVITLDCDGQHPPKLIKDFIAKWKDGAKVVIGIRNNEVSKQTTKVLSSKIFYGLFNRFSSQKMIPGSTDFRLIDRAVRDEFNKLPEGERMTRALIDWLGFKREYIYFDSPSRIGGDATYSYKKLLMLAANSFTSMTPTPLYIFGLLGLVITVFSLMLGIIVFLEQILFQDPLKWNFTGTAMLSILIMFLVGIILMSQGVLSLYVSQIHKQSKDRPLYVIDKSRSIGIDE